jgi:hypothetical protein
VPTSEFLTTVNRPDKPQLIMSEHEKPLQDTLTSQVTAALSEQSCTEEQHTVQTAETDQDSKSAPKQQDDGYSAGEAQASSHEDKVHGDLPSANDGVTKKPQVKAKSSPPDDWDPLRSRKDT